MIGLDTWMTQRYGEDWQVKELGRDRQRTISVEDRRIVEKVWQATRDAAGQVRTWDCLGDHTLDYLPVHLKIVDVPANIHCIFGWGGTLKHLMTESEEQVLLTYMERVADEMASYTAMKATMEANGV